jgi:hypothetical protein
VDQGTTLTSDMIDFAPATPTPMIVTVRLGKGQCNWCWLPALWDVTDSDWGDRYQVCTNHRDEWFPQSLIKVSLVKIVHNPVPSEQRLTIRRWYQAGTKVGSSWSLVGHVEGLEANDLVSLQSALSITAQIRAEEEVWGV